MILHRLYCCRHNEPRSATNAVALTVTASHHVATCVGYINGVGHFVVFPNPRTCRADEQAHHSPARDQRASDAVLSPRADGIPGLLQHVGFALRKQSS
jgi:hypothetical protein